MKTKLTLVLCAVVMLMSGCVTCHPSANAWNKKQEPRVHSVADPQPKRLFNREWTRMHANFYIRVYWRSFAV